MIRRTLAALLIVWSATTLAFLALSILPGDAIEAQLIQSGVNTDTIAERRVGLGLLDPVPIRYTRFWLNVLQGDLGESLISREPVISAIGRNIAPTLTLAMFAMFIAVPVGVMLGVLISIYQNSASFLSNTAMNLALSTPIYWTGTLTIYVFSVALGALPASGTGSARHLILPVLVLAFHVAGAIARVTVANVQLAHHQDFVRTAHAKGVPNHQIISKHVLRVGLVPVVSVIALQTGFLLGGTVITETLFVRPGIGRLLLDATLQQDYPIVLGIVMLAALTYALINILSDIITGWLDPRISL